MMPTAFGKELVFYMRRLQTLYFRNEKGEKMTVILSKSELSKLKIKIGDKFAIQPKQDWIPDADVANILSRFFNQ